MQATVTQTLTVEQAAQQRRSIRKYQSGPIPHADLERILDVARRAPSAFNVQPWYFMVIQNPELKNQLMQASYNQAQVGNAPAVIALVTDVDRVLESPEAISHPSWGDEGRAKTRATVENLFAGQTFEQRNAWANAQSNIAFGWLLLAAESLGYGTSPMLGFDGAKVKALLELPQSVQITALMPLGKAAESGLSPHRHALERIVTWK